MKAETIERFRISCEIEKQDLGEVVAVLIKMGFENVNYELVTDVLRFKQNKGPTAESVTGGRPLSADFVAAWLSSHPTFKAIDLVKHFRANGRTDNSAYAQIKQLVAAKQLKALGGANYQRTDVLAIEPPKADARQRRYGITNFQFILDHIHDRSSFSSAEMKELFVKNGRLRKSVDPLLSSMVAKKQIKRLEPGVYSVTAKAKANGAGHHAPT